MKNKIKPGLLVLCILLIFGGCDDDPVNSNNSNVNNANNVNNTNNLNNTLNSNNYIPEACPGYDYTKCLGLGAASCEENPCCTFGPGNSFVILLDPVENCWEGIEKNELERVDGTYFSVEVCVPFDEITNPSAVHYYLGHLEGNRYFTFHARHLPSEDLNQFNLIYCGEQITNSPYRDWENPRYCGFPLCSSTCGDGVLDAHETCDGTQLLWTDCADYSTLTGDPSRQYTTGSLSCTEQCSIDFGNCQH